MLDDATFVARMGALCAAYTAYTAVCRGRGWTCKPSKTVLSGDYYTDEQWVTDGYEPVEPPAALTLEDEAELCRPIEGDPPLAVPRCVVEPMWDPCISSRTRRCRTSSDWPTREWGCISLQGGWGSGPGPATRTRRLWACGPRRFRPALSRYGVAVRSGCRRTQRWRWWCSRPRCCGHGDFYECLSRLWIAKCIRARKSALHRT